MSQQPEAIRLAAVCDLGHPLEDDVVLIGPELRRLHAVESGAKVELMRRDNLIDSLHGLCESYRTQVESLQVEVNEQARLNGMGAERELALMAKVEILQAASVEWSPAYTRGPARQSAPVTAVPALVPLTKDQMERGRDQIFSINNPYCPCDSKTFRKVAEWVEAHHVFGLTVGYGAQPIKDTP